MNEIEFHELAEMFPLMEGEDRKRLEDDIRENGLQVPITLHEGKIIDGRNRYLACKKVGAYIRAEIWESEGLSPVDYVMSLNFHRRQLTPAQKATVAVNIDAYETKEAKKRQVATLKKGDEIPVREIIPQREKGRSRDKAAEKVGVNPRYVSDAKSIQKKHPEKFEELKKGEKTIPQVKREIKEAETPMTKEEIEEGKKRASDASEFSTKAIGYLKRIRKDDPFREQAFNRVFEWLNKAMKE